jgi:hypothetical protein
VQEILGKELEADAGQPDKEADASWNWNRSQR